MIQFSLTKKISFVNVAHRQSAPQHGQRRDDVESGNQNLASSRFSDLNDLLLGDQTEMRTFRTEIQERHGRNYRRPSSPSPTRRRSPSRSRSPEHTRIQKRRYEDRHRGREEKEENLREQQRYPRERPIFSVYRPVYRGTRNDSYHC